MGANIMLMTVATLLMVVAATASVVAPEVFKVAGKVLCQNCDGGWNEWVKGADPIKGSKVSITCLDDRSRVVQYASDLTDDAGNFEVNCNKFVYGKEIKPQNCYLRLVSSPDPVCNIATDSAGGKIGVKLHRRPAMVYRNIVKYDMGPFYYTTPMCDEPDTSVVPDEDDDSSDGMKSNY